MYTYGYQRAEILGAFANSILLGGLCLSIFVNAIERFIEPNPIKDPLLMVVIGGIGFLINILSFLMLLSYGGFGKQRHTHELNLVKMSMLHDSDSFQAQEAGAAGPVVLIPIVGDGRHSFSRAAPQGISPKKTSPAAALERVHITATLSVTPACGYSQETPGVPQGAGAIMPSSHSEETNCRKLDKVGTNFKNLDKGDTHFKNRDKGDTHWKHQHGSAHVGQHSVHEGHSHTHQKAEMAAHGPPKKHSTASFGHGHSHGGDGSSSVNIRGVLFHVMGDAIGSVIVLASALLVGFVRDSWLEWITTTASLPILGPITARGLVRTNETEGCAESEIRHWTNYIDPILSCVLAGIILYSAISLCIFINYSLSY